VIRVILAFQTTIKHSNTMSLCPQPLDIPVNVIQADLVYGTQGNREVAENEQTLIFLHHPIVFSKIVPSKVPNMYVLGCHRLSFKCKQCFKGHLGIQIYLFFRQDLEEIFFYPVILVVQEAFCRTDMF